MMIHESAEMLRGKSAEQPVAAALLLLLLRAARLLAARCATRCAPALKARGAWRLLVTLVRRQ